MKKTRLIRQHDEKDCGAACLAMVLDHYGKKIPMAQLREAVGVDQYGASIYGMVSGAQQFDLNAEAYEASPEEIWDAAENGEMQLPAVVRIVTEEGFEHYIVAAGVRNGVMKVNDPGHGCLLLNREQFSFCCLGQIVELKPDAGFTRENRKKGQISRFVGMVLSQRKMLAGTAVLSLAVTAIGLAGSFLFQYIIDSGLGKADLSGSMEQWLGRFGHVLLGLAVLYLFRALFQILRGKLLTYAGKNIDLSLMLGYFNHVSELPMNFFQTRKTGEITSRFEDAGKIRDALSETVLTVMIDTVMAAASGVILYRESHLLFFVTALIFSADLLITAVCVNPLKRISREGMEKNAELNSYLKESIDGMETVKSASAEKSVRVKAGGLMHSFLDISTRGSLLTVRKDAATELAASIGSLVVLWLGMSQGLKGSMTLGSLITFNSLLGYFLDPVENLVGMQSNIQTALAAADRLDDVMDLSEETKGGAVPAGRIERISYDHVSFRYGTRDLVLKDMNFDIRRGEKAAFVGESGCGKSTAMKLLLGMYAPESGDIRINGIPVREISIQSLRSRTAYVPQNIFLFSGSVRDNLLLGIDEESRPSDERIREVLDALGCRFVFRMPFGIDSVLEENGADLSGGQRQCLAIARAVLRRPEILILDEATSALDAITESRIQEALDRLLPEATVIAIAHRLSTVQGFSRIYVMEEGSVIEAGTHSELLMADGKYAMLWERQHKAA